MFYLATPFAQKFSRYRGTAATLYLATLNNLSTNERNLCRILKYALIPWEIFLNFIIDNSFSFFTYIFIFFYFHISFYRSLYYSTFPKIDRFDSFFYYLKFPSRDLSLTFIENQLKSYHYRFLFHQIKSSKISK